jgi:4-amino-4-deoxy-L-arabinose transferase-like glycosyltransferase
VSSRLEAAGLFGLLAAAALLFSRALDAGANYDEGVYLASADALDRGERLGEDVFASQPPGFYVLLRLATALPGSSLEATRALFLVLALVGVAAAWWLGRTLAGPLAGFGAGAMLLAAPSFAGESSRIAADMPSIALALLSLALLAEALDRDSELAGAAAGLTLSAAVSVKLFAVVAVVPAVAIIVSSPPSRRLLAAVLGGLAAVPLVLGMLSAGELRPLYDDVVRFHTAARDQATGLNGERVARFFSTRSAWTWLVATGAVVWIARRGHPRSLVPLWLWAVASAAFLVWHRPLLDHHFVLLAAACSVPAGAALGNAIETSRQRAIAATALTLVVAAGAAQQWRQSERLSGPVADVEAAAAAVRVATRPGETVVSDLPLVPYLADRPLPGELVDTSAVRFESGSLDDGCVLSTTDAAGARIVVVGRMFRNRPHLLAAIRNRFPARSTIGEITLYERPRAAARAAQAAAPESCSGRRASRSPSSSGAAPRG